MFAGCRPYYRAAGATLLGALLLAAAAHGQPAAGNGGAQPRAQQPQTAIPANPTPSVAPAIESEVERIARALEVANTREESVEEQKRAQSDLQAQQDMAKWAHFMLWVACAEAAITAIGVALVFVTLIYTRKAAAAARDAVTEAQRGTQAAQQSVTVTREIGEQQLRPYVDISEAGFIWDHVGPRIIVSCKNSGQTPATFFEIRFHTQALKFDDPRQFVPPDKDAKLLEWPAVGAMAEVTAVLQNDQLQTDAESVRRGDSLIDLYLFGVVRYADIAGAEYETEFAYYTRRVRHPPPTPAGDEPIKMSRPTGKLRAFEMVKKPEPHDRAA
jgi:hypothetical protein